MSDRLEELKKYADHRGYPEDLPSFNPIAGWALNEIGLLRRQVERVRRDAKAVLSHWAEFGPEYGLDEKMDYLERSVALTEKEPDLPAVSSTERADG